DIIPDWPIQSDWIEPELGIFLCRSNRNMRLFTAFVAKEEKPMSMHTQHCRHETETIEVRRRLKGSSKLEAENPRLDFDGWRRAGPWRSGRDCSRVGGASTAKGHEHVRVAR